jgi:acid phosphatase type 7
LQYLGGFQNSNVKQVSWETRYPVPHKESGSDSPSYYSYDVGGVHVIGLSSYVPHQRNSSQFKWLLADLKK